MSWKSAWPYLVGLALLLGAVAYMLDQSHSIAREDCRLLCEASGLDYKIRAVPRDSIELKYPGECVCVPRTARRWWEVWK